MMIFKSIARLSSIGLFFLSFCLQAKTLGPVEYTYPDVPALEATIAGSFFKAPSSLDYEKIKIPSLSGQRSDNLELRYYPAVPEQSKKPELVFVFSGIGGDSKGNISNLLSHHLATQGLHVLIVPSVFTEEFALSFSKTGYVGHMPKDAKDMMQALIQAYEVLQDKKKIRFESVKLAGYSLGALSAAHVAHFAQKNQIPFKFERVILLNSPIDLLHGLRYLDKAEREGTPLSAWRLAFGEYRPLIDVLLHFRRTDFITKESFIESVRELERLDRLDLKALVARSLKSSLGAVIMASQRIHDLGVLPRLPNLRDDMRRRTAIYNRRLKEAENLSFEDYVHQILVKYYRNVLNKKKIQS